MPSKSKRAPIKAATKHLLNQQCDSACASCRETKTATLEIHHIDGDTQNPSLENLLLLCGSCHNEFSLGTKSEADGMLLKRMAQTGFLPPRKVSAPPARSSADVVNHGTNKGVMGHSVKIGKIVVPRDKRGKSSRELPGTIGEDADMRTYADYLVKKYIDCRKKGELRVKQKGGPFHTGAAHGILGQGFGVTNSVFQIPRERFFDWVDAAQAKIRRTVFAKSLRHEIFHTWEEHLRQRGKA